MLVPHDTGQLTKTIIWNIANESVAIVKLRDDSLKLESKYLQSALQIFLVSTLFPIHVLIIMLFITYDKHISFHMKNKYFVSHEE